MRTRRLAGRQVSEVGFGAWAIAMDWWGRSIGRDEALRMLRRARDAGYTMFETADMYGRGASERLVGEALRGDREGAFISTKFGYEFEGAEQVGHSELPQRFDGPFARAALRASLERLGTDRVDMYGLHNPKMHHLSDESVFESLRALRGPGGALSFQAALGPAIGWEAEGMAALARPEIAAVQTVYNILEQAPGAALISEAARLGKGVLVRVPDASGILTGKVGAGTRIDEKDHRSVRRGEWVRASLAKVEQLRPIAERNGLSIAELAVKFILSSPGVASVLPTLTSEEEVVQFAEMSGGGYVGRADLDEVARLYAGWPPYELKSTPAP